MRRRLQKETQAMLKIIQITDTHLVPPGERLHGLDPSARLARILDHVRLNQADADLVAITGDLANDGDPRAYRALREMLGVLPMPARLLLGNHDRRANFRAAFPEHPVDQAGFIQSVLDSPESADRLIFLDSLSEGEIGGRFCDARADWLSRVLAETPDRPVTVFVHHPPVPDGMAHFANIGFHDGARLMAILRAHPGGVRHIIFGHIHIPLNGATADGIGYHAGRGAGHQFMQEFDNPAPDWIDGPANYDVIRIGAGGVSIHGCDTLDAIAAAPARFCAGP
ncbi:MAG: phosphodiesterase [Pikeienuella sp.]